MPPPLRRRLYPSCVCTYAEPAGASIRFDSRSILRSIATYVCAVSCTVIYRNYGSVGLMASTDPFHDRENYVYARIGVSVLHDILDAKDTQRGYKIGRVLMFMRCFEDT